MTREPDTRETNPGPAANDLFQLRVPHGKTPEERRADFTKGLTDFLRAKPDDVMVSVSGIRPTGDVDELERLYEERGGQVCLYTNRDPADAPAMGDGVTRRGKTLAERRKNFPKMLRAFVSANCDAEGGS